MSLRRILWAFAAVSALVAGPGDGCGELAYRMKLRFRDQAKPADANFTLTPTAPLVTRNKVQKLRLGGWRLEGVQKEGPSLPMSMLLARIERWLYFSGPAPQIEATGVVVRFGTKACRVWQVKTNPASGLYAYLVEVAPGLLALSYLSASFGEGDLASIEVQLDHFRLDARAVPAEQGQALLGSLLRQTLTQGGAASGGETAEAEVVQVP